MPDTLTLNLAAVAARFASDMGKFAQRVQTESATAVRTQMLDTRQVIVTTTPVDTGNLQSRWGPVEERSTSMLIAYGVTNDTPYGPVLEYGGYRRAGSRTVALGGGDLGMGFTAGAGVYSRQAPLGWVRRALAGSWRPLQVRLRNVLKQAWPYGSGTVAGSAPLFGDVSAIFGVDLGGESAGIGLSPGTQQAVREVLRGLRTQPQRGISAESASTQFLRTHAFVGNLRTGRGRKGLGGFIPLA